VGDFGDGQWPMVNGIPQKTKKSSTRLFSYGKFVG